MKIIIFAFFLISPILSYSQDHFELISKKLVLLENSIIPQSVEDSLLLNNCKASEEIEFHVEEIQSSDSLPSLFRFYLIDLSRSKMNGKKIRCNDKSFFIICFNFITKEYYKISGFYNSDLISFINDYGELYFFKTNTKDKKILLELNKLYPYIEFPKIYQSIKERPYREYSFFRFPYDIHIIYNCFPN